MKINNINKNKLAKNNANNTNNVGITNIISIIILINIILYFKSYMFIILQFFNVQ